jgi:hypothetical protein
MAVVSLYVMAWFAQGTSPKSSVPEWFFSTLVLFIAYIYIRVGRELNDER